jgi:hypothetical protein
MEFYPSQFGDDAATKSGNKIEWTREKKCERVKKKDTMKDSS